MIGLSGCSGVSTKSPAGPAQVAAPPSAAAAVVPLPNQPDSLKFLAFGDFGTGEPAQYELAKQMTLLREHFPFEMVVLVGDNLYGAERPQDFKVKFEQPYKPLLDSGVKFYASLGNHDAREQKNYPPFNMNDKLYYSFKAPKQSVRFYAFESTYMTPEQVTWIGDEDASRAPFGCSCNSLYVLFTSPSARASPVARLMRIELAVVAMPPLATRGLPVSASIWSAGV
jgi:hypothetical protein